MLLLLHLLQSGAAPYSRANPSCTSPLSHNSHNLNRKSSDESSDKSLLHTVIHASWRQVEAHFTPAPYIYTHIYTVNLRFKTSSHIYFTVAPYSHSCWWCNYTNPILTNYTSIYSCYSPVLPSRGLKALAQGEEAVKPLAR